MIMQEMLWLLANHLDYEKAAEIPVTFGTLVHDEFAEEILERVRGDARKERKVELLRSSRVPLIDAEESPRVIKTHLPLSLLPPKLLDTCKVVYVARNPKDVAVSYYHLNRRDNVHAYQGDFPKFWDYFTRGLVVFGPHCDHVAEAWSHRNHPNMKFLFYENLITDMKGAIRDLASHIGKKIEPEQIERLSQHLSIDSFRKNKSINDTSKVIDQLPGLENENEQAFIRHGKNHGWQEYFTSEMNVAADLWVQENYDSIPDFAFPKP
ncbi:hypothetical protein B566_EDAN017128 [Ephemera danica]|nr:hypothetical protein B566_EDAN017128 [Ephemera danica]